MLCDKGFEAVRFVVKAIGRTLKWGGGVDREGEDRKGMRGGGRAVWTWGFGILQRILGTMKMKWIVQNAVQSIAAGKVRVCISRTSIRV